MTGPLPAFFALLALVALIVGPAALVLFVAHRLGWIK